MPKSKTDSILTLDETIISKIYVIREQKVMLDFDLATLYEVETRVLNQAVKRNIERFPEDFMFILTAKEWQHMISQFVISSEQNVDSQKDRRLQNATASQKRRKTTSAPYAFTEHGVTMLATVLKSERAVKMSIAVVRAFIGLKKSALQYNQLAIQSKHCNYI